MYLMWHLRGQLFVAKIYGRSGFPSPADRHLIIQDSQGVCVVLLRPVFVVILGHLHQEGEDGNWVCGNCTNVNWWQRKKCMLCKA